VPRWRCSIKWWRCKSMQIAGRSCLDRSLIQRLSLQALVYQNHSNRNATGSLFLNRFQNRHTCVPTPATITTRSCETSLFRIFRRCERPCTTVKYGMFSRVDDSFNPRSCINSIGTPSIPFAQGSTHICESSVPNCLKSSWTCKSSISIVDITSVYMTLLVVSRGADNPDHFNT
jgi:hypothetical protein